MAKKMRRFLALVLALALCAGQIAMPAMAAEEEGNLTATITITEVQGENLPAGTTTVSGGSVEKTVETTTTTVSENEINTTTTTSSESWSGTATSGGAIEGANAETSEFVETSNTTTTTITGTETTTDVDVDNGPDYPMSESSVTEGSETTVTTNTKVEEKTETEKPVTETTDNEYVVDPEVVNRKDSGVETTKNTSASETVDAEVKGQPEEVTLNMSQTNNTDEQSFNASTSNITNADELLNFDPNDVGIDNTYDANGNLVKSVETKATPIKDGDTVIGYTIVKTTTTYDVTEGKPGETKESSGNTNSGTTSSTVEGETKTEYRMPDEPVGGTSVDAATGNVTTVTVEKIEEGEEHVGYKTITVVTDASGKELSRETESIYRTEITTAPTTKTDTTTDVTTSTLTTDKTVTTTSTIITDTEGRELVPIYTGSTWGWVYKAELSAVLAGEGNGEVKMVSLTPSITNKQNGKVDTTNDLYNRPAMEEDDFENKDYAYGDWDYKWLGEYGLESAIRVEAGSVTTWQPHQFVLVDEDGNKHYVYCADFEVSPQENFRYDMENLEDADYYNDEYAQHIRAIAMNGYWGTESGTGSLEAVKALMEKSGLFTKKEIDNLTAGEALTATQAAIWKFGNSGSTKFDDDIVGAYYNGGYSFNYNYENETVQKLYDYLITLTEEASEGTTLITENNFATNASITVYDKVEDAVANLDNNTDNDVYNTSISFSLLVEPTEQDDLVVTVLGNDNEVITKIRLAGDDSEDDASIFSKLFKKNDEDKTYTIENLQIAEGVNITLNLSGTQYLNQGVYLYTSEVRGSGNNALSSQTFVGLGEGERDVNLNVNLKFEVTDPQTELKTTDKETKQTISETRIATKSDTKTVTEVSNHITVTTEVTETTKRAWTKEQKKEYTYEYDWEQYDDDWGDGDGDGFDILDEDVPLANAPKTGDISGLWAVISLCALGGVLLLNKKREEA